MGERLPGPTPASVLSQASGQRCAPRVHVLVTAMPPLVALGRFASFYRLTNAAAQGRSMVEQMGRRRVPR